MLWRSPASSPSSRLGRHGAVGPHTKSSMTGFRFICQPEGNSYLKTLSEQCGEPEAFRSDLTKAEASKRIEALKSKRRPVQPR